MNVGRYLRGEDRHVGTARVTHDRDLAGEATERDAYVQRLRADISVDEADEELADQRAMLDQEQPD